MTRADCEIVDVGGENEDISIYIERVFARKVASFVEEARCDKFAN